MPLTTDPPAEPRSTTTVTNAVHPGADTFTLANLEDFVADCHARGLGDDSRIGVRASLGGRLLRINATGRLL